MNEVRKVAAYIPVTQAMVDDGAAYSDLMGRAQREITEGILDHLMGPRYGPPAPPMLGPPEPEWCAECGQVGPGYRRTA